MLGRSISSGNDVSKRKIVIVFNLFLVAIVIVALQQMSSQPDLLQQTTCVKTAPVPLIQVDCIMHGSQDMKNWTLSAKTKAHRRHVIPIVFPTPFDALPRMMVFLCGLDIAHGPHYFVSTFAQNVSVSGFELVFEAWGGSGVNAVGACWIAVESAPKLFDSGRLKFPPKGVPNRLAVGKPTKISFSNPNGQFLHQHQTEKFTQPMCASSPTIGVGLSALEVNRHGGSSVGFAVQPALTDSEAFQLSWAAQAQNVVVSADATWFGFDESVYGHHIQRGKEFVGYLTDEKFNLFEGMGRRVYEFFVLFPHPFTHPPRVAAFLGGFDLSCSVDARFQIKAVSSTKEGFTFSIASWGDSRTYSISVTWIAFAAH